MNNKEADKGNVFSILLINYVPSATARRINSADWVGSVFKTTAIPFAVTLALAILAGYLMHHYLPDVTRISELLSRL